MKRGPYTKTPKYQPAPTQQKTESYKDKIAEGEKKKRMTTKTVEGSFYNPDRYLGTMVPNKINSIPGRSLSNVFLHYPLDKMALGAGIFISTYLRDANSQYELDDMQQKIKDPNCNKANIETAIRQFKNQPKGKDTHWRVYVEPDLDDPNCPTGLGIWIVRIAVK